MDEVCFMEGHTYPDEDSPMLQERMAAARGEPPSKCRRCGEVNLALRAYLAGQIRKRRLDPATRPANGGEG